MSREIPNRWLHCPRKSETVIAERFIAFKTPLSSAFNNHMPFDCFFTPDMLFGYCKSLKLKLGLWIDLTNTKRYYDRKVVESCDAKYVKLQCRGHGETPSMEQTRSFIEIVCDFVNERPFDIIAVHCTHGFNRTGFLICSYLVERLDCSVQGALSMFASARPPGIYKQDYIDELLRRYEDADDAKTAIQAPEMPPWCLEYDDSDGVSSGHVHQHKRNHSIMDPSTSQQAAEYSHHVANGQIVEGDYAEEDASDNNVGEGGSEFGQPERKKKRRELVIKNAAFMQGVPGVKLFTDKPRLAELQQKVQEMCGWEKSGFPGTQPVSMDRVNILRLNMIPYRVSWKADGMRYMMLINKRNEIYFFDRNFSCFEVENMTFLKAGNLDVHLEDTLLDGEMVLDKVNDTTTPRYLIYDIIRLSNEHVGLEPFYPNRLQYIKQKIIDPHTEAIGKGIIDRKLEPFSVRNKEFWDIRQSGSLLSEKFAKLMLHEVDGLIFQPSKQPYTAGVCDDVFKWKPHEMNSVDFRLRIKKESGVGLLPTKLGLLYVGGHDKPMGQLKVTKAIKDLDNKIVECTINSQGQWEFMRERTDKTLPNSRRTAVAVCKSICQPVTKESLLKYIERHGFRDDHDIMPPPHCNQVQRGAQQQQQQQKHHHQMSNTQQAQEHQQPSSSRGALANEH